MKKRDVYISNTPLEQAKKQYWERIRRLSIFRAKEIIQTQEGLGRLSAAPVFAEQSNPHYNAAAMDGIAVRAKDTFGASEKRLVTLEQGRQFAYVDTGDLIPADYDAVIMIEDVIPRSEDKVLITKGAVPWQHIRPIGEDIASHELIIPTNHQITPVDIGAMLAGGVTTIEVYKQPRVGIIPTGSELVSPGTKPRKGEIIDFNSQLFKGLVTEWGGLPNCYPITADDYHSLRDRVQEAACENDVVLVNAGSSAGTEDYTAQVISDLGEVVVHGVAIKPGKPTILGVVNGKPIIGVPGYPVSAFFVMELFVKPLLAELVGLQPAKPGRIQATLAKQLVSSLKHEEFVRVRLGNVGGKTIASPLNRGAGVLMSLVRADGYVRVPRNLEGHAAGEKVEVTLLGDASKIAKTIVSVGSHDPMLDVLADLLRQSQGGYYLSSSHVGSMGGVLALKRGECHVAGMHLLDPQDGTYNRSYLQRYLPGRKIALLHMARRQQGLMVQPGNPKGITDFADLTKAGVAFINRQKGSGTRILLDYHLSKLGVLPDDIYGYEREEFTHLTTASAVAEGSADVSLGVYSAAKAFGLDFIPIASEEYELAIPLEFLEEDSIKQLQKVVDSAEFEEQLISLGGYDLSNKGKLEFLEIR